MIKNFSNLSKCYYICPYVYRGYILYTELCIEVIEAITFFYCATISKYYIYHLVLYRRCADDISILAKIGGSEAHYFTQIDIARRQDVSVNLRMLTAARQFIRCGNTFTGTSRTPVRTHRAL